MPVKDSSDDKRRIGLLLREARQHAQMSQAEVAKAMSGNGEEYHQTQIAKIERGARSISLAEAVAFMDAVQGDLHQLVSLLDNPDTAKLNQVASNLYKIYYSLLDIPLKLQEKETLRLVLELGASRGMANEDVLEFVDGLLKAQSHVKSLLFQLEGFLEKYIDTIYVISSEGFEEARSNLKILDSLVDIEDNQQLDS